MANIPPSWKVLLTTELAEQILCHLPFESLIQAELVCRTWHSIISWSHRTRQGLFLEPSKSVLSMPYQSNAKLRKPTQWRSLNVRRYTETYTIALLHPWLENLQYLERTGMIAFTFKWWKLLKLLDRTSSATRWRDMYITQPPCRNVKIEFSITTHNGTFTGREWVKNVDGIKLGLIVDKLRQLSDDPGRFGEFQPSALGEPPAPTEANGEFDNRDWPGAQFVRLNLYIDGFITESAAFALATRAAAAACATAVAS